MANNSILSAFERMWQHIVVSLNSKSNIDHKHDASYDAIGAAGEALEAAQSYTDTKTSGLASTSSVNTSISTHNTSDVAHNDIRDLITALTTKLNAFLDVDDTTTDQLSEVLTLIENNKGTLESLTSSKVNVSDVVNNLTTNVTNKPLSAAQGVAIKALIDALDTALDEHGHAIADVSGLQTALNGKAASGHNHDDKYYTETEVDAAIADAKNTWYGTCTDTSQTNSTRVVTTTTQNFTLTAGNILYVLFSGPPYMPLSLNVDGTGAVAIKTANNIDVVGTQWTSNEVVGFAYDGTYFRMLDGAVASSSYYGMTRLSSSTNSTSTSLAATPKAVKAAYDLANTAKTAVDSLSTETWTFTLEDGSTVTKAVYVG